MPRKTVKKDKALKGLKTSTDTKPPGGESDAGPLEIKGKGDAEPQPPEQKPPTEGATFIKNIHTKEPIPLPKGVIPGDPEFFTFPHREFTTDNPALATFLRSQDVVKRHNVIESK